MARIRYVLGAIVAGVILLGLSMALMACNIDWPIIQGGPQIVCPVDNDPYVWTPIWDENLKWICLRDGHTWTKSYPTHVYQQWRMSSLSPEYIRDYTVLYLRQIENKALPDPLTTTWTGGRERVELNRNETYVYHAKGIVVIIGYPRAAPDNIKYTITVQTEEGTIVWEGQLFQRQFISNCGCEVTP